MNPSEIAAQFREVYLNGRWVTATNLKQELTTTSWDEAVTKIDSMNSIAELAFHIQYYVAGLINVLQGGPLDIRDKYSFDMPEINSAIDWSNFLEQMWVDGERFAELLDQLDDGKLDSDFAEEKYGTYYRNVTAIISHCYYHLGQIVLIRKYLLRGGDSLTE